MAVIGTANQIITANKIGEIGYVFVRQAGNKNKVLVEQILTVRELPVLAQQTP